MPQRMAASMWTPSSKVRIGAGSSVDMPHAAWGKEKGRWGVSYRHEYYFAEMASCQLQPY